MKSHPEVPLEPGDAIVYMASLPVTAADNIPPGMVAQKLPASKYAVFTHKGPLANLPTTIRYIWGTWVPGNAEIHKKDAPDFELYDERFNPETLDGEFDIYIPII
jgi:AraC family transcriptional regulator